MLLIVIDIKKNGRQNINENKLVPLEGNFRCKFHLTVNFYIFVLMLKYAPVAQ